MKSMKSMKSLSMNKMLGGIMRKGTVQSRSTAAGPVPRPGDSPEQTAHDSVKAFCESGFNHVQGDEVLFLPPIVDAAESSPAAAAECARMIGKFMSKDYLNRTAWQYNAIMLLGILTENPGPMFTRYIDSKFVQACKNLLRGTKDLGVRQMLIDTLYDFETRKSYDENLFELLQMWTKEKTKMRAVYGNPPMMAQQPSVPDRSWSVSNPVTNQNYFSRHHTNNKLPDAAELANRLEEARTSAKLLEQVVMNTTGAETLESELIKDLANRCLSASRSIQGYMTSSDPTPDNETMESLIDTNEQLQSALNQHQRSVLSARKQLELKARSEETAPAAGIPALVVPPVDSAVVAFVSNNKGKQTEVYHAGSASNSGPSSLDKGKQTEIYHSVSASSSGPSCSDKSKHGRGDDEEESAFQDGFTDGRPYKDPFINGRLDGTRRTGGGSSSEVRSAMEDDLYESDGRGKRGW